MSPETSKTRIIREALEFWSDTKIGSEEERELYDRAIAALDAIEDYFEFGTEGVTARQGTDKAASVGSPASGASPQGEVGAG